METQHDQFSIKNLLFTKAVPNYVIPIPTAGYKVYTCFDCGDKYMFESSLQYHVNRKSLKISYHCRLCNKSNEFYNRCNLLSHIRGHSFKTATINITDLKVEPLPLHLIQKNKQNLTKKKSTSCGKKIPALAISCQKASNNLTANEYDKNNHKNNKSAAELSLVPHYTEQCFECKESIRIPVSTDASIERIKHYMKETYESISCSICQFKLPTKCAYKAHLRFHFGMNPLICPECGLTLINTQTFLDSHGCQGIQIMKSSTRVKCPMPNCHLLSLSEIEDHLKAIHLKPVFKCSSCYFACIDKSIMIKHLRYRHNLGFSAAHIMMFYQCQLCSDKLILGEKIGDHLESHKRSYELMFPCWVCGEVFDKIAGLIEHQFSLHEISNGLKECFDGLYTNTNKIYRVVKRCEQCLRNFSYKCRADQISNLPTECPYKCSAVRPSVGKEQQITCHICKNKMALKWELIKKHYSEYHKSHRCLDIQVHLPKINIEKYKLNDKSKCKQLKHSIKKRASRRKRMKREKIELKTTSQGTEQSNHTEISKQNNEEKPHKEFSCRKCSQEYENKELLEKHLLVHRDSCMAYQCMECGECFVVKPSFSKHLTLEHNIADVDQYVIEKKCYNEDALQKYQDQSLAKEPLEKNQCSICRLRFENSEDLEKHFRVHGMAFLMKNNCSKNNI